MLQICLGCDAINPLSSRMLYYLDGLSVLSTFRGGPSLYREMMIGKTISDSPYSKTSDAVLAHFTMAHQYLPPMCAATSHIPDRLSYAVTDVDSCHADIQIHLKKSS